MSPYQIDCRVKCKERLDTIRQHIDTGDTLLDVGCAEGYFTLGLQDKFLSLLGIDSSEKRVEVCRAQQLPHTGFIHGILPKALDHLVSARDTILYMSVQHHMIEQLGWDKANDVFRRLSGMCKQMFFDMGQKNEVNCERYGWWQALPETDDQEQWIHDYIAENTDFTKIELIGSSPVHGIDRLLWKLEA